MTIPIPRLPFFAIGVLLFIVSIVMQIIKRGSPNFWMAAAGVCALFALAGG